MWFQNDHLGTPQKIIAANGTVAWQANYDSFGQAEIVVENIDNNLRFPGQYFDLESGLVYDWHRHYDPETGRYISADPIGLAGGMNLYAYVQNDPVNWIDPWGLAVLPPNPGGLGDGWVRDDKHKNPNGEKWDHPDSGHTVEWHPAQPGKPGWRGKDHWHVDGGHDHLPPGTDVPDLPIGDGGNGDGGSEFSIPECNDTCQTWTKVAYFVTGVGWVIYNICTGGAGG